MLLLTGVSGRLFEDGDGCVGEEVADDESSLFGGAAVIRAAQLQPSEEPQHVTVQSGPIQLHEPGEVALGRLWNETETVAE